VTDAYHSRLLWSSSFFYIPTVIELKVREGRRTCT